MVGRLYSKAKKWWGRDQTEDSAAHPPLQSYRRTSNSQYIEFWSISWSFTWDAATMAAARQPRLDHDTLQSLRARLADLEREHKSKQHDFRASYKFHEKQCAESLHSSLQSLFEIIALVHKTDKDLINWYRRSKGGLRTTLRLLGVGSEPNVKIEKKTRQLQDKVQRVEEAFDQTGLVFDSGLNEAKRLRSGFLEFSTGSAERVSQQALSTLDVYDQQFERANALVTQQSAEHEHALSEAESLRSSLQETR